jgi:EpsI family protein
MDLMQKRLISLLALLALTLAAVQWLEKSREQQRKQPAWNAVPYEFKEWRGLDTAFDPVYGEDPADSSLLRVYAKGDQLPVIVYVGFYVDLAGILDVHTPELCYPAQGWTISPVAPFEGTFRGRRIPAKEILAERLGARRLVTWWYNAGSRPFETRIRYLYAMLMMSTLTGRTDGSLVRIESPIDAGGQAAAQSRIEDFRKSFLPMLEKALP